MNRCCCCLGAKSCLTLWPVDCNPPGPSVHGSSRQEYWCGLPFSSPGNLPNQGIEPMSPAFAVDSLPPSHQGSPIKFKPLLLRVHLLFCKLLVQGLYRCLLPCCSVCAQQCPTLCDPWTAASQAPLSMEFFRQEYWSRGSTGQGPGDLSDPGIEPVSLVSPELAGRFFTTLPPGKHTNAYRLP